MAVIIEDMKLVVQCANLPLCSDAPDLVEVADIEAFPEDKGSFGYVAGSVTEIVSAMM